MPPLGFEPRSQPPQGRVLSRLYYGSLDQISNEKLYKHLPYFYLRYYHGKDKMHIMQGRGCKQARLYKIRLP